MKTFCHTIIAAGLLLGSVAAHAQTRIMPLESADAPSMQALKASAADETHTDADYTPWEVLGTATLNDAISSLEYTLNVERAEGDEEIKFEYTTEILVRNLVDDPQIRQYKFVKFLGYDDIVVEIDASTSIGKIDRMPLSIPVPSTFTERFGTTAIEFQSDVDYYPTRKIFSFRNAFFFVYGRMGYSGFGLTATLPDAHPEIGFWLKATAGGVKSTDKSITMTLELYGIDHVRYIAKPHENTTYDDLSSLVKGTTDYKTATSTFDIEYTAGGGYYSYLVAAFDENDTYTGIYYMGLLCSNLAPEGEWESIGRGVWHYPGTTYSNYTDSETGEYIKYEFPEEKLQWEVEIEKRTDTDREIYRVVNPYGPECGLAETFEFLLDQRYAGDLAAYRPDAFINDDTFWFVFDMTDPDHFTYEDERPNGLASSDFLPDDFTSPTDLSAVSVRDRRITLPGFHSNDLVIDMPDFKGVGFDHTGYEDGYVTGYVDYKITDIKYIIVPATSTKPDKKFMAAEARNIIDGTSEYKVNRMMRHPSIDTKPVLTKIPYENMTEGPSWMLIVPTDNDGVVFDHAIVLLDHREVFKGVTLTETLMSPFTTDTYMFGRFDNLTVTRSTALDNPGVETYTLNNPYFSFDPGWYKGHDLTRKDTDLWKFIHDRSEGNDRLYFETCESGVSPNEYFDSEGHFMKLIFSDGSREGDTFTFKLDSAVDQLTNIYFAPQTDNATFVFTIPGSSFNGVEDVSVDAADTDAPVEYYDLSGRRVANPSAGIYIRRQGNKTSKIFIR